MKKLTKILLTGLIALSLTAYGGGSSDSDTGTTNPLVANAGNDLSVEENTVVTITGSGIDSDGTIVSYEWKKGSTVLANTASFSYTSIAVGTDTLTLTVMDDDGATASDSMNVDVNNSCTSGADYYVSTLGDDTNNGSVSNPWKTISHAANKVVDGGTIHIAAGVYFGHVVFKHSGTADHYLTVLAEDGVIIDGKDGYDDSDYGLLTLKSASFIIIDGIEIRNSKTHGILVLGDCTHVTIKNCTTKHTRGSGINVQGNWGYPWDKIYHISNLIIENNEIHWPQEGRWDGHNIWHEDITLRQGVENFNIHHNYVNAYDGDMYDGGPIAIDVKDGVRYGEIHHNTVVNIPSSGIYVDAWETPAHDIEIYNNKIDNVSAFGIEIGAEMGGAVNHVNVYNNIISNTGYSGFISGDFTHGPKPKAKTNINVFNNTFYNVGTSDWGWGILTESTFKNGKVYNNIFSHCTPEAFNVNRGDNNSYTHNLSDDTTDPQFIDELNGDFRLQGTSPAIDAGISLGAPLFDFLDVSRPLGNGIDLGAYEYKGNAITPIIMYLLN